MKETELYRLMLKEVRQLLVDLEAGRMPANPMMEEAVRKQALSQMKPATSLGEKPSENPLVRALKRIADAWLTAELPRKSPVFQAALNAIDDAKNIDSVMLENIDYVSLAVSHGVKLNQGDNGLWQVMDQSQNILWLTHFEDEKSAAAAFCHVHGIAMEPAPVVSTPKPAQRRPQP